MKHFFLFHIFKKITIYTLHKKNIEKEIYVHIYYIL